MGTETIANIAGRAFELGQRLLFNPSYTVYMTCLCLAIEIPLNLLIIQFRAYTEIDWEAYMQEVGGVVEGEYDYARLEGGTGPLVYPAGFVYAFGALYYLTDKGTNILRAQYIFAGFYCAMIALIGYIYVRVNKCPPVVLLLLTLTSYRIHSVFVLRLFNDPVAMLIFYAAVVAMMRDQWLVGCILYSLAVSVKMNVLLFAPGLLILLLARHGPALAIPLLAVCAAVQVSLAMPFLLCNPWSYITRAFDFGRVFLYKWTVNWRLLPEDVFLDRRLHMALLLLHVAVLALFMTMRWARQFGGVRALLDMGAKRSPLSANDIAVVLFTSNAIGMAFSRSLHYQFYVWYYHSLPLLLWAAAMPTIVRVAVLAALEIAWNTYPSTPWSSALMHVAHLALLIGLWRMPPGQEAAPKTKAE